MNVEIRDNLQSGFKIKVKLNSERLADHIEVLSKRILEAVHFREVGRMSLDDMNVFLEDMLKQYKEISIVSILNEIGEEETSGMIDGKISPLQLEYHLKYCLPEQLDRALKMKQKYSDIYHVNATPYISLYTPFQYKDRPAPGTIVISLNLKSVQELIQQINFSKSSKGMALLFDQHRNLIFGKRKGKTLEELKELRSLPKVKSAFQSRKGVDSGSSEFEADGQTFMGAYKFIDGLGWLLLIAEPKAEVYASADLLFDRTLGIILVTIVLSIFAGWLMAKKLVKPILALVKGAEEIGAGNLDYKIEPISRDEIGQLCESFSMMGGNLKHRELTISKIRTVASELNSLFERDQVLKTGIGALQEITNCSQIKTLLKDGDTMIDYSGKKAEGISIEMLEQLREPVLEKKEDSFEFKVPLGKEDPNKGWLSQGCWVLESDSFTLLDQQVAQILAGAVVVSLMNIEFLKESVTNERRAHELELAELVQRTLYPEQDPDLNVIEFGSYLLSSSETGGDWYGYIESEDKKRISVLIGDVTGHGAPAALLTAATNSFFRTVEYMNETLANQSGESSVDLHDPVFLLKLLNKIILETARGRLVMTFFISTIDLESGEMVYANAGHNAPWVWRLDPERDSSVDEMKTVATPVKKAGKIKIKLGKKKIEQNLESTLEPSESVQEEAKPKRKIKIKMGSRSSKKEEDTPVEEQNQNLSSEEKPKRKLKIRMGSKTKTQEGQSEETPKKRGGLKIKIGKKKGQSGSSTKKIRHWENVSVRGMRLGEVEDVDFETKRTRLLKGDIMVWYTDGWIENTNEAMEEYGKKRMQKVLEDHRDISPDEMIKKLKDSSWDFYGNCPREDDVTIIIGKVKGEWE